MSFNINTKLNNLQYQLNNLEAGSISNPLNSNLNANNFQIENINTLSSTSGSPLYLTAKASTINCDSAVNMVDTLTINNTTVNNGLVVKNRVSDTSCFVVDQSGNVGVKVDPSVTLTTDFTVNGNTNIAGNLNIIGYVSADNIVTNPLSSNLNANNFQITNINSLGSVSGSPLNCDSDFLVNGNTSITGNLNVIGSISGNGIVNNIGVGFGLNLTGTSASPIISILPVGIAGTYSYPSSIITNVQGQITSITSGSAPSSPVKLGAFYVASSQQFPVAPGGNINIVGTFSNQIQNDITNGVPSNPNGVWIIDFSAYTVIWDKPYDTLNNDSISFSWDDGTTVVPFTSLNPPLQGIFTQAPPPFYPTDMYKCGSLGQLYMNPNQLKTYGLNGTTTTIKLTNNSTTATIRGGTFSYLVLATYYPDGLIP